MKANLINFDLSQTEFNNRCFERELYLQRRAFRGDLVSWDSVTAGVYAIDPSGPNVKIYLDGQVANNEYLEAYQDGYVVANRFKRGKLRDLLRSGATLVVNKLDRYVETIGQLSREIGEYANGRTVANAYIAFGGDGTFGKHWDTHCVFALQLQGRKRWRVFAPTMALPLDHQSSAKHKAECPSDPIFDQVLEAGDVLYIPRGWWHEALPIAGHSTLHIAVGLHTPKIHDYICWVTSQVLSEQVELRRSWTQGNLSGNEIQSIIRAISNGVSSLENQQAFMIKHGQLNVGHEAVDFEQIAAEVAIQSITTGRE